MRMPGGDRAIVDRAKLTGYCLNPDHPRGKHKARVFAASLGIGEGDASFLRDCLLAAGRSEAAEDAGSDEFGRRYVVDFEVKTPTAHATVRSVWIVRHGEDFPRLTTCFVLL